MVCGQTRFSIFKLVVFVNHHFMFSIRIKVQCIFQILRIEVSKQSLAQFVKVKCRACYRELYRKNYKAHQGRITSHLWISLESVHSSFIVQTWKIYLEISDILHQFLKINKLRLAVGFRTKSQAPSRVRTISRPVVIFVF